MLATVKVRHYQNIFFEIPYNLIGKAKNLEGYFRKFRSAFGVSLYDVMYYSNRSYHKSN
jgi:hypothetical protein